MIDNVIKYSYVKGKIDIVLKLVDKSHFFEESGMGLVIVKKIIDLFEGTINIFSRENKGITFVVKLPIMVETNKLLIK